MNQPVIVFRELTDDEADLYSLILSAAGIVSSSEKDERGWIFSVSDSDYQVALNAVREYLEENQNSRSEPYVYPYEKTFSGFWAALLLSFFYIALGSDRSVLEAYGASASQIMAGEYFRLVTSLMLHLNAVHLLGNIIGTLIFATATCGITGAGVGWFLILLTGVAGNFAGALVYQSDHLSAGASTAVFGALGVLSAHQVYKRLCLGGHPMGPWVPIASGLALLGVLGTSAQSDLAAHFFGYMAGVILGTFYTFAFKRPLMKQFQILSATVTAGIIVISWMTAFG